MTKINQIWKCEVCGNIVEVLHEGIDSLVCCRLPLLQKEVPWNQKSNIPKPCFESKMVLMEANSVDASVEKHVPVVDGKKVSVGSVLHPMDEDHYIEWIEATGEDGRVVKRFLNPGEVPVVEFCKILI